MRVVHCVDLGEGVNSKDRCPGVNSKDRSLFFQQRAVLVVDAFCQQASTARTARGCFNGERWCVTVGVREMMWCVMVGVREMMWCLMVGVREMMCYLTVGVREMMWCVDGRRPWDNVMPCGWNNSERSLLLTPWRMRVFLTHAPLVLYDKNDIGVYILQTLDRFCGQIHNMGRFWVFFSFSSYFVRQNKWEWCIV